MNTSLSSEHARAPRTVAPTPRDRFYLMPTSSMVNSRMESGGIAHSPSPLHPAPFAPYPSAGGMRALRMPPTFIGAMLSAPITSMSHPLITSPTPALNTKNLA